MEHYYQHTNHRTVSIINSSRLNMYPPSQQHLVLSITAYGLKVCCTDAKRKECLYLVEHKFSQDDPDKYLDSLTKLYHQDSILQTSDWLSVTLCIDNQRYTILPEILLDKDNLDSYLAFACAQQDGKTTKHFLHQIVASAIIFDIDTTLYDWFTNIYKHTSLKWIHKASALIEGSVSHTKLSNSTSRPHIFVFTENGHMHIVILNRSQLLYYNRFAYTSNDEWLQYLLIVMQTLGIDPEQGEVILVGAPQDTSMGYRKAKMYIRRLSTNTRFKNFSTAGNHIKPQVVDNHFDIFSASLTIH